MGKEQRLSTSTEQELQTSQARTAKSLALETGKNPWGIYDSALLPSLIGRIFPESNFLRAVLGKSFQESFAPVVGGGIDLKKDIETALAEFRGKAVAVEFGGTGSKLFAGFADGFFARTLGMNLVDRRTPAQEKRDQKNHHTVIAGDMMAVAAKAQLADWLQGQSVHLIIERMMRGLEAAPNDVHFIGESLKDWYQILAEGGLMYLQAPRIVTPLLQEWAAKVARESNGTIQLEWGQDGQVPWMSIRVRRLAGAPAEMPMLSAPEIATTLRQSGGRRGKVVDHMHDYLPQRQGN